jgi:hypothetical protein
VAPTCHLSPPSEAPAVGPRPRALKGRKAPERPCEAMYGILGANISYKTTIQCPGGPGRAVACRSGSGGAPGAAQLYSPL